jgi:caa(3)-type oxidase subunit IV
MNGRRIALAWAALLALMLTSLGSAYLSLGVGNVVAGVVIACIKTGIVVTVFMRLGRAGSAARLAVGAGLALGLLLASLSALDLATRGPGPAAVQPAEQQGR